MAAFRFRFETLLRHRRAVEDRHQRQLAQHLRRRMIFHDQIRQMQDTIRSSKHELGQGLVGKVDLEAISGFARYSGHATQRAQQLTVPLAALEGQIVEARGHLLEAVRRCKALERLRDRHLGDWRRAEDRRENIELDEVANQRFVQEMVADSGRPAGGVR